MSGRRISDGSTTSTDTRPYVRFVVHDRDPDSHVEKGIFVAVSDLRKEDRVSADDGAALVSIRTWFDINLPIPERLARSLRPNAHEKAISWFKSDAVECISRINDMIEILRRYGVRIEIIRTKRPGYVVYEDEHQVVAEPFHPEYRRLKRRK